MLINYGLNHEDKNDIITNTMILKSADNSPASNGTRFQTFSETSGNMEAQLGKSVTIEVNRGLVYALIKIILIRMSVIHVGGSANSSKFSFK